MNPEYEAIHRLKIAKSRLDRASSLIDAEIIKAEISEENRLHRAVIESAFAASMDTVTNISFALDDLKPPEQQVNFEELPISFFDFDAAYNDDFGFHFRFSRLPNLKTKSSVSSLSERFVIEVGKKVEDIKPSDFVQMNDAHIIFVSHFAKKGPHNSLYFDNDNLAIKAILDAIVPLVCFDDASRYCDNHYISQDDVREYTELFVIKKSCLKAWARSNSHLDVAKAGL